MTGPGDERRSLAEVRALAQPPEVLNRRNAEHWSGTYLRRVSVYLTYALLPTGISANGVTGLMILTGLAGAAVLLWTSAWAIVLCAVLMQLQILIDCSDGEVARVRRTTSSAGVYLDRLGHWTTEAALPLGLGIHVDGGPGSIGGWTTLGALTGLIVLVNKGVGDLVHVARAHAGLPVLADTAGAVRLRGGVVARARALLAHAPVFRAFISIEFSLILLVLVVVDELAGTHLLRGWAAIMAPVALVLTLGHLAAVLLSNRLPGGRR
ncbi:MAG: CDP-alcohol phosphatidyltransferase family protein [Jatrophihabitans sp.]|uniref:CDP-alcohol phosphatidyltransferase family protein n=1 Tax=Jatrophihabitans sp. TaxID=1932789 RepID=UPI003F7EBF82